MQIGYRVAAIQDIGRYPADLVQISYWGRFGPSLDQVRAMTEQCRGRGIPYVIHPVFTSLSETDPERGRANRRELLELASMADLGLIVHDEVGPDGGRLAGEGMARYLETLTALSERCPVSVENANRTADIDWFWEKVPASITLDLGHVESAGLDSVAKVGGLSAELLARLDYVHLHRNNGDHGGITDHWPLERGCRELMALAALARRRTAFAVILEINEMEEVGRSLDLVRAAAAGG